MNRIELRNLTKVFPRPGGDGALTIVEEFNLDIEPGKTLAIVGPSGCGKTTLLNMLALLEPCDAGQVVYDGQTRTIHDVGKLSLGYLFQRDALLPWRTAWGNALLGLACRRKITTETKDLVASYFKRFGLAGFERAWPGTLSGGQRQRVALIQNLLIDPDVLLLDEPFGSLDYQTKLNLEKELLGVIRAKNGDGKRKTVVFVTHDIEEAIVLADRVVVLGQPPQGILFDEEIPLSEMLRDPVAARQSDVMQRLFGKIWAKLQPRVALESRLVDSIHDGHSKSQDVAQGDSELEKARQLRSISIPATVPNEGTIDDVQR